MFRYKKRVLMTIIGVAGCTALLVTAFGLHDGMSDVAKKQYGDIFRYKDTIILKQEVSAIDGDLKFLLKKNNVNNPLLIKQNAYNLERDDKSLDLYIIVPQNNELFTKYYQLKSTLNRKNISLDHGGITITQRIAKVFNIKKGDVISIKDTDNNSFELTVSDIAENYTSNYIYMNTSSYNKIFGKKATFNAIVSKYDTSRTNLTKQLTNSNWVANVIFTTDEIKAVSDYTKRLNGVIVLITLVASLLAVVVLYNLTSINISERIREIATLKVLGFRNRETNAYIYREAFILTIISIGIGLIAGIGLHHYVTAIIERGAISLSPSIKWISFVMACAITMVFSLLMQIITYLKLKKVNMVESLKSVE